MRRVGIQCVAACLVLLACSSGKDLSATAATEHQDAGGSGTDAAGVPDSSTKARPAEDVVGDFLAAWNEHDVPKRTLLIESSFARDGSYTDSGGSADQAADRSTLSAVIGRYQSLLPAGTIMSLDSAVDAHHDQLRYKWKIVGPGGTPLQTGEDQGEWSGNGLLQRITGFFDAATASTPSSSVDDFIQAFGSASTRTALLATATADSVVWKDREKSTSGRAALEARIAEWTTALSITGLAVDSFAQHDDVFRARFHATSDTATVGELFGHTAADGAIDWATVFDGELR